MANNKKAFLGVGGKPRFSQPDQQKHIDSVSKNIAILTGQTKNTKDRAVLVRDLMDFGLLDARGRFTGNGGTTIVGGGNNGGGIVNPDPETPTKPVNVRASAAFTTIMVQWDFPNYAGHEHAEIWRNTIDALGDMTDPREEGEAVLVATVAGSMYMDNVLPETGYYYWVRFVNVNGLAGPVHSASGVYAETLPDIETILNEFQEESLETLQTFQDTFNGQIDRLDSQIADFGFEASKLAINQLNTDVLTLTDGLFNHIVTTERNYNDWLADAKALGDRADVTEAKLEQEYYTIEDITVLPHQGMYKWEVEFVNVINEEVYNSYAAYPEQNMLVSDRMQGRGIEFLSIQVIPYKYYPKYKKLEVYTSISIQVIETGENPDHTLFQPRRSHIFDEFYKDLIVNFSYSDRPDDYQASSILYIAGGNWLNNSYVQDLLDWRHRQGYLVHAVSTSEIGASNGNENTIKNYIKDAYDTWDNPPEIVGLIGDTDVIDCFYQDWGTGGWNYYNGATDFDYTQLDGNDLIPEVFIGRISGQGQSDAGECAHSD